MKDYDNPNKKTYCYSNKCKLVETGFNRSYTVCTVCKEEISDSLKASIDNRNNGKDDEDDLAALFQIGEI